MTNSLFQYDTRKVHWCDRDLVVRYEQYDNGRIAIELQEIVIEDGEPVTEDWAVASVNLPDAPCPEGYTYIKDYSENQGVLSALVRAGIVELTSTSASSGFVNKIPLVRVTPLIR